MQYITTKDFAVAISLINREIEQMEYYSEHPPVFEKEFTDQEIKDRKEKLKENRWYQDLLEARKNFNLKVNFDIIEEYAEVAAAKPPRKEREKYEVMEY